MNELLVLWSAVTLPMFVVVYVWTAWSLSAVFKKMGLEGWQAWVPVLNLIVLLRIGGFSGWLALLALVPVLGQIALAVILIFVAHRINVSFGFGAGMTVLAALLPPVWTSVLGWGSARWLGAPAPAPAGPVRVGNRALLGDPARTVDQAQYLDQAQYSGANTAATDASAPPFPMHTDVSSFPPSVPPLPAPAVAVPPVAVPPVPTVAVPPVPVPVPIPVPPAPAPVAQTPPMAAPPSFPPPAGVIPPAPGVPLAAAPAPISQVPGAAPQALPPVTSLPATAPIAPIAPRPPAPQPSAPKPVDPWSPPAAARPGVGQAAAAVDDAGADDFEDSADVSAIVSVPAVGDPRSARSAISAQHALAEIPDEDIFDVTIMAARKRATWALVPPLGDPVLVTSDVVIIGRRPAFDADYAHAQLVPVADDTRTVSKTHARLERQGENWMVIDLDSTNGVILVDDDGDEIDATPGVPERLTERFLLGDAPLRMLREGS